ncbi:hypothetical protein C7R57_04590 [Macrococcoides caseolyticum subsp. caseolyticum]|uniref:hypothetical protein n=1 Tax=Macrococcoides caseolyticum TaxID=69966 RepID=UPI000CD27E7C|nr:hypothetical protein [Macrococcus caseolyticus]PNZ75035.1 hypothetical protein CD152_00825 [Macrococcus caseolyticus]QPT45897.1 hypothetical protein I6G25_06615 [Macrococcus caseolyticus]QQB05227.1 hypothetical protein I6H62_09650 [Macrococcus caseolyticus]RAK47359.1 hypothetical protein C7R57_04590 [Macrococcus caseolyticus subsp. caseolyticus]TDM29439.1 hypothetical protein ETH98_05240 [Macrococcus caseolyticus]
MRILSVNVNNFGGTNNKPILYDYKSGKKYNWGSFNKDVDNWRSNNETTILKNVKYISDFSKVYDLIFFYEVDTNSQSWNMLLDIMNKNSFEILLPNHQEKETFKKGRNSITCGFIKQNIDYTYGDNNFFNDYRSLEIIINDVYFLALHMKPFKKDLDKWDKVKNRFDLLKDKKSVILGDLNVFATNDTNRRKFDGILASGAIDLWMKQGESNDRPTHKQSRIDYILSTEKLYDMGVKQSIIDKPRLEKWTDHSAVALDIVDYKK